MIVDCHTRVWESPRQLGIGGAEWLVRNGGLANLSADTGDHLACARTVDRTLVWGFRSRHLNADIPNKFIADYAAGHSGLIVGIAAVDPPEPDVMERLRNIAHHPEFGGVVVNPAAGGFHPTDSRAMQVYEFCAHRGLPVFVETGADMAPQAVAEYARPSLFDEVARAFPAMPLMISSLGWPWVQEAVALMVKQPRVYCDVAALIPRAWECYQAILLAHQRGVADKLLFGSDFPFSTAKDAAERLYRLNDVAQGSSLPAIPREVLRGIVERDALKELSIE